MKSSVFLKNSNKPLVTFNNTERGLFFFSLVLLATTLFVIFWPLACIWAFNTLFGFQIPITFWTWLASYILIFTLSGAVRVSNK